MHENAHDVLKDWVNKNQEFVDSAKIAELGCQDVNGNILEIIPTRTGFDLMEDASVDVVIEPGIIPEDHKHIYDLVVTVSSFQFCPNPHVYIKEILDLLKPDGKLFLLTCGYSCIHKTAHVFFSKEALTLLFSQHFDILEIDQRGEVAPDRHCDTILIAQVKHDTN